MVAQDDPNDTLHPFCLNLLHISQIGLHLAPPTGGGWVGPIAKLVDVIRQSGGFLENISN